MQDIIQCDVIFQRLTKKTPSVEDAVQYVHIHIYIYTVYTPPFFIALPVF